MLMRDKGHWAIAAGLMLWVGVILLSYSRSDIWFWVALAFAQVWLPVTIYLDIGYVQTVSHWQPKRLIWTLMSIPWVINIVVGGFYLVRRLQLQRALNQGEGEQDNPPGAYESPIQPLSNFKESFMGLMRAAVMDYRTSVKVIGGVIGLLAILIVVGTVTPLTYGYVTILLIIVILAISIIRAQRAEKPRRRDVDFRQ